MAQPLFFVQVSPPVELYKAISASRSVCAIVVETAFLDGQTFADKREMVDMTVRWGEIGFRSPSFVG